MRQILKKYSIKSLLNFLRIPLMLGILGILFIGFALLDNIINITHIAGIFKFSSMTAKILFVIAGIILLFKLNTSWLTNLEKRLSSNHKISSLILSTLRHGMRIFFILLSLNIIINIIEPRELYLIFTKKILNIGIIASIGWIAIESVKVIEEMMVYNISSMTRDRNRVKTFQTKSRVISNIVNVIIGIIALAAMLMTFDSVRNVGISILASAGFLTAILGIAASKTLSSLLSGVQIALSQTIKIGDTIVVEKQQGVVEEITFTYIIIKLSDNRHLTIPINYFVEKSFENWSKVKTGMSSSVYLYVDYNMPIDAMRAELNSILNQSSHWNGKTNKIVVANLTENNIQVRMQISADNIDQLSELCYEVREKMLAFVTTHYIDYLPRSRSETMRKAQNRLQENINIESSLQDF